MRIRQLTRANSIVKWLRCTIIFSQPQAHSLHSLQIPKVIKMTSQIVHKSEGVQTSIQQFLVGEIWLAEVQRKTGAYVV